MQHRSQEDKSTLLAPDYCFLHRHRGHSPGRRPELPRIPYFSVLSWCGGERPLPWSGVLSFHVVQSERATLPGGIVLQRCLPGWCFWRRVGMGEFPRPLQIDVHT